MKHYPTTTRVMRLVDQYADTMLRYTVARQKGHRGRSRQAGGKLVALRSLIVQALELRASMDRRGP